ncbi:hypothetical protein [Halocatena pleomorpha]|uniref:Uncharacterized protein n=1 Tax=Halocatena pleomorpha TaxID=1785090 RepID=A0A3P3RGJ3_9EURY|nr:hypothetical protein [Halocatena pleomorpha]RRJ31563.1 hypothetical protein EIK79_07580 [Halocatena pleomorpha]
METLVQRKHRTETPLLLADGGEEAENADGNDEAEDEAETRVLHLDLEGLFLDLLGLEVDLDEVVLDITAVSGPENLLGNLLSAVAGLLDDGLPNLISGDLLDDVLPSLPSGDELKGRIPSPSDAVFGAVNVLLDAILAALEDGESTDE